MSAPRSTRVVTVTALVAVACRGSNGTPPIVRSADPAFGPLAGGTIVELVGSGFLADAAAPDHVVVGGIESPLASVIDDHTLQFLLPSGSAAGDVEIGVFNQNGNGSATGIFHYSSSPTIASASPGDVLYTSATTTITLTGSGFQNENAGLASVLLDGVPAVDVAVQSDNQLTFTAPPGQPLVRPSITIVNARGSGTLANGYLYIPSTNPGLLLFPNDGRTFFSFFDTVAKTFVTVPLKTPNESGIHLRAVVGMTDGSYVALRSDGVIGTLDMSGQQIGSAVQVIDRIPAATLLNGVIYGVAVTRGIVVTIDPATGSETAIGSGSAVLECCGAAIAANGSGTLFVAGPLLGNGNEFIGQVNLATGALTNTVQMSLGDRLSEMRFLGSALFGIDQSSQLLTIDPATGSETVLEALPFQATAMETLP